MALYLIDLPFAKVGLDVAKRDSEAKVVLIQDGVFADASGLGEVYALKEDVEKRGVASRLGNARIIDYDELVDLIVANKVVNFG
ncbi:MAG: DsrH/TusB family sulfur metabolism protein [Thermoleophilia bacterium]|nr:DsrH/TusB family sulfur metabolism protein [Thermoleophilia bacterium]